MSHGAPHANKYCGSAPTSGLHRGG
jgi:hypothetical protein